MPEPTILLYGFAADAAAAIRAALEPVLVPPPAWLSAAGMKERRVAEILAARQSDRFEESPVKVLLMAGLDDDGVGAVLAAFPSPALPRPLFCALTATNRDWTFESLVRHLFEERAEFARRLKPGA